MSPRRVLVPVRHAARRTWAFGVVARRDPQAGRDVRARGTRAPGMRCVNWATVRPRRRLAVQAVVTVWPACPGSARAVLRVPHPSRRSRGTVSAQPGGVPLRLSRKLRLSWKLLAAIVALFFRVSHMFHDIVTVVDYRCEMVFRVTAARPPLRRWSGSSGWAEWPVAFWAGQL